MPTINVNKAQLYYQETTGKKETVVFAHGYLMNHTMFDGQIEVLKEHFNCIAYDHRGHGQSEITPKGYELQNLTNDAIGLLESLNQPVHFVGMSTGGFVGMRIALQRPELLKSLVLMDTSAEREPIITLQKNYLMLWVVKYIGWFPVIRKVLSMMFHRTFLRDPNRRAERKKWKNIVLNQNLKAMVLFGKGIFSRKNVLDKLPSIKIPTLVVVGEFDKATPPRFSQHMVEKIDKAALVTIPDTGHSCAIEQPELVTNAMLDFYKDRGIV